MVYWLSKDVGCGSYPKLVVHFWHIALLFWILFVGTLIELRSSYLPFVCFEYLMIFWMFYHINWFKKISTNRTWIVDCSRSFPPDSRCSSMPMSPMAMCQLLCGAGDGFNISTLRSLLVPLRSQKNPCLWDFQFLFIYFCTYISGDFFIVCFKSISFQESRNNKTGKKPPKNIQSFEKPHVTLSRECISVAAAFLGVVFWMDVASREPGICGHPQKTMVVSKIPSCLHARLEEMIYKYVKNMGTNHQRKYWNFWLEDFDVPFWVVEIFITESASKSWKNCRDEGLAEALANGLLRPHGVVATNFLPHVDLVLSSRIKTTTVSTFHNRSTVSCGLGSSSGSLRQCLSFKARNQFFNSGSGAPKKLNFTFFVVVSLYIYISVNIVVGGLFQANHGGGC